MSGGRPMLFPVYFQLNPAFLPAWGGGCMTICRAHRQACAAQLAELGLARCAEPAVSHPFHQFALQHEVRALLLLAAAQSAGRSDVRGDRVALRGSRPDRESEPFGRRALPAQGVRRNLPPVHQEERRKGDLRSHQRLFHRPDNQGHSRRPRRAGARRSSASSFRSTACPPSTTSSARRGTHSEGDGNLRCARRASEGGSAASDPRDIDGDRAQYGRDQEADHIPLRPLSRR